MTTTIAQIKGRWYVVRGDVVLHMVVYTPISKGYATSEQARAQLCNIIFGRVS